HQVGPGERRARALQPQRDARLIGERDLAAVPEHHANGRVDVVLQLGEGAANLLFPEHDGPPRAAPGGATRLDRMRWARILQRAGEQALYLLSQLPPRLAVVQLHADALRPIAGAVRGVDPGDVALERNLVGGLERAKP